jgi:hypothetical protein
VWRVFWDVVEVGAITGRFVLKMFAKFWGGQIRSRKGGIEMVCRILKNQIADRYEKPKSTSESHTCQVILRYFGTI